jgi:hypothetical protein
MANPFEKIRSKAGDTEKSLDWYKTQVKTLLSLSPNRLMTNAVDISR